MNVNLLRSYLNNNDIEIDITQDLDISEIDDEYLLIILSVKSEVEGNYELSNKISSKVLEKSNSETLIKLAAKIMKLFCKVRLKPSDKLADDFHKLDHKIQKIADKNSKEESKFLFNFNFFKAHYHTVKSTYWFYKSNYSQALQENSEAIKHWKVINQQDGINLVSIDNLFCYNRTGKFSQAISTANELLESIDHDNDQITLCHALMARAETHELMGDYGVAASDFQQAYSIATDLQLEELIFHSSRFLARIYAKQGLFEQARHLQEEALSHLKNTQNDHFISLVLNDLGITSRLERSYNVAENYHLMSIENSQNLGMTDEIITSYYNLILLGNLSNKDISDMHDYYDQIQILVDELENPRFDDLDILSRAIVLQYQDRLEKKFEALTIFKSLVNKTELFYDYRLTSVYFCLNLLLFEYNYTKNQEVLTELEDTLKVMKDIGDSLHSFPVIIDYYMLKARFEYEKGNKHLVTEFLNEAKSIADISGVEEMKKYVKIEQNLFQDELELLTQVYDPTPDGFQAFGAFSTYLDQLQMGLIPMNQSFDVEPIIVMIISSGGLNLFAREFIGSLLSELNLVSSFLSAMTSFTQEAFDKNSKINMIKVGNQKVILQTTDNLIFSFIFKGYTSTAVDYLNQFVSEVETHREIMHDLSRSTLTVSNSKILRKISDSVFQKD